MTSMPASRSARAITLAPRSCPSRPGLATSTRILTSAIDNHLTTGTAISAEVSGRPALQRLDIQAPPHIPASNATIWLPHPRDLFHILRLGQFPLLVVLL